jgi:hypothetical protein
VSRCDRLTWRVAEADNQVAPEGTLGELFVLCQDVGEAVGRLLDHTTVSYHDINAGYSSVFVLGDNPHRWGELDGKGQHALGQARALADTWGEHVARAIAVGAPERLDSFEEQQNTVDQVLRRNATTWWTQGAPARSIPEIRESVERTLAETRSLLGKLPTANGPGGRLFVPDTNALIYEPAIEKWQLPPGRSTLVFVPQVIRELDEKKMNHRIGDKASAVINRLKEYGRRGDTFQGVRVVGDVWAREVAQDADVAAQASLCRRARP